MDQFTALDLSVPAQRRADRGSFDYRPKVVEAWLKNLPIANLGETSRALYDALHELNRLKIKPAARLACLEVLGRQIDYVRDGLRKHYPPREFPLPPKSRKIAELVLTLLREMATGYNIIVQAAQSGERVGDNTLALSIYRTLRYSGAFLIEIYGIYEPCPAGLWKVIHGLYLSAEGRKLESRSLLDTTLPGRKRSSVADAYKQILLLAVAGPYRMRMNEANEVHQLLERWAPLTRLLGAADAADATFIVRLGEDLPPVNAAKDPVPNGDVRGLVTARLQGIADGSDMPPAPWRRRWRQPPAKTDPELVRRILISLGMTPKRQYSRLSVAKHGQVQVMVGLSHINKALAGEQGLAGSEHTDTLSRFASRDVRADWEADDVWDLVFPADALAPDSASEQQRGAAPRQPADDGAHWRFLNVSAGGYCLLSDPTQSARAQVGELIALRELGDKQAAHWQAGVIRWMKHVPGEGLQLGVQVLAPGPVPVSVRAHLDEGGRGAASRALMLPEVMAVEQPVTLIAPSIGGCQVGRVITLSGFGGDSEVVLTHQLEANGAFAQYGFRSASTAEPKRAELESVFSSI